jgi:hypothetical protein
MFTLLILTFLGCPVAFADTPQSGSNLTKNTQLLLTGSTLSPRVQQDWQNFTAKKNAANHVSNYVPTYNEIQVFVDNEANTGAIENTPVAKLSVTKAIVRASMKIVVEGGYAVGYTLSASLLSYSLQDYPETQCYNDGSWQSNIVKNGAWYISYMKSLKTTLLNHPGTYYYTSGSTTLNSPTDLELALNKVSYYVQATKSNGIWTATVVINDTYNFEYTNWVSYGSGLSAAAKTALNNYGAYAQSTGQGHVKVSNYVETT